jgi:hypothetical protein
MLPVHFFFANKRAYSGYMFSENGAVVPIEPDLGYETLNFDTELAVKAFREFYDLIAEIWQTKTISSVEPLASKVIGFCDNYGLPGPDSDAMFFELLAGMFMKCFDEQYDNRPTKIRIERDDEGRGQSFIEPGSLVDYFVWISNFPPKNSWTVCRYRLLNEGQSRARNLGKRCPPLCILPTDGRRQWGDGCQPAWNMKQKRERK